MKLKELKRTVNVSWSPAGQHPVYLAAGSAAQQVDASFSSTSQLDIYALNLEDPGLDLELKSSVQTQHKFQKLAWSGAGLVVGGCDSGLLQFYSAEKLLQGSSDALLGTSTKHTGHVSALDVNPYQKNLLASGASDSEIFIWDLNNTAQPMAPGNRSQPYEHVQAVAWNQQVQHILGSTFASRCVIWDLRKNEPIMKLSDSLSRTRWRALAWHPSVATQLCIASEEDSVPVIQLWDLRLAESPLVTLEGHHKGVLALSWCRQDPELLLSGAKDGRVLAWNPNNTRPGGELLCEVSAQPTPVFDVSWSPRCPALLAAAAAEHVAVRSLLATERAPQSSQTKSNIMDSFGGADSFSQLPAVARAAAPQQLAAAPLQPPRAPLWLKRPVGARFAFGGKLVQFDKCSSEPGTPKQVYISQVVSEPEIVEQAAELDAVLGLGEEPDAAEKLAEYCRQKGDAATDQNERYTWFFLRANFLPTFRTEILNLLGFKQDEIPSKFKGQSALNQEFTNHVDSVDSITSGIAGLSRGESTETDAELSTDTSTDLSDAHTQIERKLAGVDSMPQVKNVVIPNGEDSTSMICRALICGNLEEAVELCLEANKISDALVIASLGSPELLAKVQQLHLQQCGASPVALLCGALLLSRWDALLAGAAAGSWRQALAHIVAHCAEGTLHQYCELLGDKLSEASDASLAQAAILCYLCAPSGEALAARWAGRRRGAELALLTQRAAAVRGAPVPSGGRLDALVRAHCERLCAAGCLAAAARALRGVNAPDLSDRIARALDPQGGQRRASTQPQPYAARTRTTSHTAKRAPYAEVNNAYGAAPQAYEPSSPWQQASVAAPQPFHPAPGFGQPAPGFGQPAPGFGQPAPGFGQPAPGYAQPAPYSPAAYSQPAPAQAVQPPPLAQPARPANNGPQGITSRSKYKVDPSVQAAPQYAQYHFTNPAVQPAFNQGYGGGYNSPLPDQYSSASVPNSGFSASGFAPLNPAPVSQAVNGYYPPPAAAAAAAAAPAHEALPPRPVAPGWNDPPIMSSKPKTPHELLHQYQGEMSALHAGTRQWGHIIEHRRHLGEPKPEVQAQTPITHPLFGAEPPQHVPLNTGPDQYAGQYPGQQQFPAQQYPGQSQGYPPQQYPGAPQGYTQAPEPPAPVVEAAPIEKGPIPEEHALLQSVFDSIRNECSNRAPNPQIKRKLEDVQKKLENLYDLLREYRLSESALSSLHTCAAQTQAGDYAGALHVATSLATAADFASVASFLPGLKVLLQLAQQLQVYAR